MRVFLGLILLAGCGPKEPATVDDPPVDTDEKPDNDALLAAAAALYAPDRMLEIEIEMAIEDGASLAAETNSIFNLLEGEDCLDEPPNAPFNWYPGNIVIDGERIDNVGFRKKGLIGSLSTSKPGLKVEFDKYVDGQTFDGLERLTLNNSVSDSSLVRQCLGYQLFRDAGIAAPRCNFAHVTIAGQDLGVYVNVEPVKKTFLKWAFDGDDDGQLYEGTLSDFRDDWTATFEPKTKDSDPGLGPIHDVREALEIAEHDSMIAVLGAALDLENFYDFWVMELLIGHVDGYTANANNYFVYQPEETGLLEFMPWGIDSTFEHFSSSGADSSQMVFANSQLSRRLWENPDSRAVYYEHMERLLGSVWHADEILAEVDRMADLVEPFAIDDAAWRAESQDQLRGFIGGRAAEMQALMEEPPHVFDEPLRTDICLIEAGTLRLDFDTTWATLQSVDPLGEGYGRVSGDLDGVPFDMSGGAIAGFDGGNASFAPLASIDDYRLRYGLVALSEEDAAVGTFALDGVSAQAVLAELDLTDGEETIVIGTAWSGTLTLEEFTGVDGSPVRGHMEGVLYTGGPF